MSFILTLLPIYKINIKSLYIEFKNYVEYNVFVFGVIVNSCPHRMVKMVCDGGTNNAFKIIEYIYGYKYIDK